MQTFSVRMVVCVTISTMASYAFVEPSGLELSVKYVSFFPSFLNPTSSLSMHFDSITMETIYLKSVFLSCFCISMSCIYDIWHCKIIPY